MKGNDKYHLAIPLLGMLCSIGFMIKADFDTLEKINKILSGEIKASHIETLSRNRVIIFICLKAIISLLMVVLIAVPRKALFLALSAFLLPFLYKLYTVDFFNFLNDIFENRAWVFFLLSSFSYYALIFFLAKKNTFPWKFNISDFICLFLGAQLVLILFVFTIARL